MTDNNQAPYKKLGTDVETSPRLGYALWQAQHAVERVMEEALKPLGISLTQAAGLLHLSRQPGLSGAELARRLLITPQSTATILGQMEERGWVVRQAHAVHRAVVEVHVTPIGLELLDRAIAVMDRVDARIARGLEGPARVAFADALVVCQVNALELSKEQATLRKKETTLAAVEPRSTKSKK